MLSFYIILCLLYGTLTCGSFFPSTVLLFAEKNCFGCYSLFTKMKRASSSYSPSAKKSHFDGTVPMEKGSAEKTELDHHFHLGDSKYVSVSDFGDYVSVHLRKFKKNSSGRLFPTKEGISISPTVWFSLMTEIDNFSLASNTEKTGKNLIVEDSLFISTEWNEDSHIVVIQRYLKKKLIRLFLPTVCVLSESQWGKLPNICKQVSESIKSLMFENILRKLILAEVFAQTPMGNVSMTCEEFEMILTASLTELVSEYIGNSLTEALKCHGCRENYANQLGHECITMNYETQLRINGDKAIFSLNLNQLSKDFVQKNIQMSNFITETFLNNLNMKLLLENAQKMYVTSDPMPDRMF